MNSKKDQKAIAIVVIHIIIMLKEGIVPTTTLSMMKMENASLLKIVYRVVDYSVEQTNEANQLKKHQANIAELVMPEFIERLVEKSVISVVMKYWIEQQNHFVKDVMFQFVICYLQKKRKIS